MKKSIIRFMIVAVFVLIFQILYFQLMIFSYFGISKIIPIPSNDIGNMLHHFIMFILVFIPTFIIQKKKNIDFGYKGFNWKKGFLFIAMLSGISLVISLIQFICGDVKTLDSSILGYVLFQLFFSGLGEEILYRAIPLTVFGLVYGSETSVKIKGKIDIDFGILVSALFFAIGHISFILGQSGISYSWVQMICAFITGTVLGYYLKYTKSIWLCMIGHGVYNTLLITFPLIGGIL